MKTRSILFVIALTVGGKSFAQTTINKTLTAQPGQRIIMHFDYPKLVRVSTWDKNEISIQGSVSINGGENDDAFELLTSTSGNTISIRNEIKNQKSLPQRITIQDGTKKITFASQAEYKRYQAEHGRGAFEWMSSGVDMEISLEIKIPRNMETRVESVYGMVEIKDFTGPLIVDATYGGVDAALIEKSTGEIAAETNFGEIYTNLDSKFGSQKSNRDFHTYVTAKPGSGPKYSFESKYGNVYLRKAN